MNIAFCYETVNPARGGCETYIIDISRRLLAEGHRVHLYASEWDEAALPEGLECHRLPKARGPRYLRPWRFGAHCAGALQSANHQVTVGFNKTWGQDVLYPQGGLHAASFDYNLDKYKSPAVKQLVRSLKRWDPTQISYRRLERQQYLAQPRPIIIVNSYMVRGHFQRYYDIPEQEVFVVRSAIDPQRFCASDRPRVRLLQREQWNLRPNDTVGLFAAMNYRLKGLGPLLHAVKRLNEVPEYRSAAASFRLLVVGHSNFRRFAKLAQQLGIAERVTFAGHCPQMHKAYFSADFLIHPTFYDPCSLVVLEAFACSLPVITTRSNGAGELIRPLQEGYVIDSPHDQDRLAACIFRLLDSDRRSRFAKAAHQAAQRWTFDHHYRALLQVFQQAAAHRQAA